MLSGVYPPEIIKDAWDIIQTIDRLIILIDYGHTPELQIMIKNKHERNREGI